MKTEVSEKKSIQDLLARLKAHTLQTDHQVIHPKIERKAF